MIFSDFYSRPWAVAMAWWIGILGCITGMLGLYWGYESQASRELLCVVDPATAQIVKSGASSQLSISFKGQAISSDITAAQVVLWNAGKLAIKRDEILQPIVLVTSGHAPILEATIRANSRDLTGVTIDGTDLAQGRLKIVWSIFERDDGVRIQLIYAGGADTKINVEGVIEGQGKVATGGRGAADVLPWVAFLFIVLGALLLSFTSIDLLANPKYNQHPPYNAKVWKIVKILLQASAVMALSQIYWTKAFWLVQAFEVHPPSSLAASSPIVGAPNVRP